MSVDIIRLIASRTELEPATETRTRRGHDGQLDESPAELYMVDG